MVLKGVDTCELCGARTVDLKRDASSCTVAHTMESGEGKSEQMVSPEHFRVLKNAGSCLLLSMNGGEFPPPEISKQ